MGSDILQSPTPIRPHMLAAALNQRLQTTLEPTHVLEMFRETVEQAVPGTGVHFDAPPAGFAFSVGATGPHVANYNLDVDGVHLGGIRLGRNQRLSEQELGRLEELLSALAYPLRNALAHHAALHAAQTDPLTGLFNQTVMDRLVERELAASRRNGSRLGMLVVDLDNFKAINDQHGHQVGDHALKTVAETLKRMTRASDYLFRYGGEEFVVLVCDGDETATRKAAERILQAVRDCAITDGNGCPIAVTASIGLTTQCDTDSPQSLFNRADLAMYSAKDRGRNQISDTPRR